MARPTQKMPPSRPPLSAGASNLITLADNSGLEVTALGGEPGLHSHRYAPTPNATDADRRAFLLRNLRQHPRPWQARFVCTIAIAVPEKSGFDPRLEYATGECPGEIIPDERGSNGFGYDPVFLLQELGKTMAELSTQEKNRYSHRSRALHARRANAGEDYQRVTASAAEGNGAAAQLAGGPAEKTR